MCIRDRRCTATTPKPGRRNLWTPTAASSMMRGTAKMCIRDSYYTEGPYRGKMAGTIGDIGVYSFNGNKIITTGAGGMVVSNHCLLYTSRCV